MNGPTESMSESPVKLDKLQEILDEYEKGLGLKFTPDHPITEYLQMNKAQIEALTPVQCEEICLYLSNYLIFLQSELNRQLSKMNWAEAQIKLIVGKYYSQLTDFKFEARVLQIVEENQFAKKLELIRIQAKSRVDTLSYIPTRIEFFIKTLSNLAKAKAYKG